MLSSLLDTHSLMVSSLWNTLSLMLSSLWDTHSLMVSSLWNTHSLMLSSLWNTLWKTIIRNKISRKNTDQSNKREDNIGKLNREEQVMIFRARTGHCQLLSHMYKLKLAHTNECPCGTGIQTVEHILQDCPQYTELRSDTWRREVDYLDKLWGSASELRKTADFLRQTNLKL